MTMPNGGSFLKKVTETAKTEVRSWFNRQQHQEPLQNPMQGPQGVPQHLRVDLEQALRSIAKNRDALRAAIENLPRVSSHGFPLHRNSKQVNTTYLPVASIERGYEVVIKIECKSEEFMKHLQRYSEKGHLAHVLKLFSPRPCFVLNESLRLASGSDSRSQSSARQSTAMSRDEFRTGSESILGTRALLMSRREGIRAKRRGGIAVVGGVIVVNNTLYGLSVGHYDLGHQPLYEERSASDGPNPSKLTRVRSFVSGKEGSSGKTDVEPEDSQYLMTGTVVESLFSSDEHPTKFHDWALVELTLDMPYQNSLRRLHPKEGLSGDATDVIISDIFSEQSFSKSKEVQKTASIGCFIVTKQAVIPGEVSAGCTSISLGVESSQNVFAEVLIVCLKKTLPRGSSGSWVIIDTKLLGTVIAGADNPPRAFVAPIEDTFQSIKEHLHATRVCLPSRAESNIFKLRRLRQVSRWLRSDDEEASDDGGNLLELELLLAQRQSELNPYGINRLAPGTGWVAVSREEKIEHSARFLTANGLLNSRRLGDPELSENTARSLLLLGHIFPVDPGFRVALRKWLSSQESSNIDEPIVNELLHFQNGENVLGLIFVLCMVLDLTAQDQVATWLMNLLMSLFKSMEFPPSWIPSAYQLLVFVNLTLRGIGSPVETKFHLEVQSGDGNRTLSPMEDLFASSSGVKITVPFPREKGVLGHRLRENRPTLDDLKFSNEWPLKPALISRLLLQLSDVTHSKGATVLVCAGDQEMLVVGWIATFIFGLTIERREFLDGKWRRVSVYPKTIPFPQGPHVYVFYGQDIQISEVLDRNSLSQF
ncbi:hypothetical protein F4801DRAFT_128012 [Xylaria longipes]|nr:hypothetical protein F4801DRAFT_128012 [Xylaria longipes]